MGGSEMSKVSIRFFNENTIDGKSRNIAYTLWESNLVADKDVGKVKSLQQIHAYLFGGLYDFAGKIRTKTISKGNTLFCLASHMDSARIRELLKQAMTDRIDDREIFMKGIDYSYYYEQSDLVSEEPNSFELDRTRGLSNEIQQEDGAEVVDEGKEGQA